MKQVDDAMIVRVERSELLRQLSFMETSAARIRSKLGLVQREAVENVDPDRIRADGITRMRTDQLDRLAKQLTGEQYAAAEKFRTVWEAISRGLYPGGGSTGGAGGGRSSRGSYRHPLERMSEREFFIWINEYRPWANGPAAKTALKVMDGRKTRFEKSYLQVCYAVIIDNFGPSQLERQWPISRGNGIVTRVFKEALSKWRHCDVAIDKGVRAHLDSERKRLVVERQAQLERA